MTTLQPSHRRKWLAANQNLVLFVSLTVFVVLLPAFEDTLAGEWIVVLATIGLVAVAALVNARSRRSFWPSLVLGGSAAVLRLVAFATGSERALIVSWTCCAAVLLVTMLRLLADVFAPGDVDRDRLFGCATVYLLIGLLSCFLFAILEQASPGSFSGLTLNKVTHISDFAYFSFNLATNVALTNGMPVSRPAQILVLIEEVASVMYMAFVISRLVGMYGSPQAPAPKDKA